MKSKPLSLDDFLRVAPQFQLGALPTEQSHPDTVLLSQLSQDAPEEAAKMIWKVDQTALQVVQNQLHLIEELQKEVINTWESGGRVFLAGCGATGRLSLALESLYREQTGKDNVIGFMAGADYALIKSIESFEDHPEYGERQLNDLGFSENDLMIGITEGGETPFVIGATEIALTLSKRLPYFLYCNPDSVLEKHIERSRRVIHNSKIKKINLCVGPMILSGSTRLQASTVLMLAVGMALLETPDHFSNSLTELQIALKNLISDSTFTENWVKFSNLESQIYKKKQYLVYETENYGMTVLTDITERSPTFSLKAVENKKDLNPEPALCSLLISNTKNSEEAWKKILLRAPRVLNWNGFSDQYGLEIFLGFDLSSEGLQFREKLTNQKNHILKIRDTHEGMVWELGSLKINISMIPNSLLGRHLFLKILLNTLSVIVMGQMGRFEGNVMLYVRPTNFKLIDRTIRYAKVLLSQKGCHPTYEEIACSLFQILPNLVADSSAVLGIVQRMSKCS